MRRLGIVALAAVIVVGVAAAWLIWPDLGSMHVDERAAAEPTPADIERGRYLVTAGDCIACHTAQGGTPFAGGRRIPTPFGDIYGSNLTPDDETGLGRWTAADFWRALHYGRSRDGRRLYPAFPYTNYTRVSRADADAMFAYLRTLAPERQATPAPALRFPYSTQIALRVWRALYFRPGEFRPDPQQTPEWNRGAYLVEGLGHCDACHTGRNWLGGSRTSHSYAGGPIPMLDWEALPLTAPAPISDAAAREMAELLKAGTSRHGVTTGPMAEVVFNSLQYLDDHDIAAMVTYIRTLPYREPAVVAQLRVGDAATRRLRENGAKVYAAHCADCHGEDGKGRDYVYPALAGNSLVTAPSPANAIQTVLFGGYAPSTARMPRPYGMPPYGHQLSEEEIAGVLTYIRGAWGNQAAAVSPVEVGRH